MMITSRTRMSMKQLTTLNAFLLPTTMVLALSGCGGGGGGASTATAPIAPAPVAYSAVVTSVPAPVYALPDDVTIATQLNAARQGSGSGLLAQSTVLDLSAHNHTNFLVNNQLVGNYTYLTSTFDGVSGGHYENPSLSGYSGQLPQARAAAAGYTGTVSELITFGTASGADCIAAFENSVYHLAQMLSPSMDVGIDFNAGNGGGSACAIELGVPTTSLGQLPASGTIVTFPNSGMTGVAPTFYNQGEDPDPAPDLSVAGHPVLVSLYTTATPTLTGSDIVIQTFSITPANGSAVAVRVLVNSGVTSSGPAITVDNTISAPGELLLLPTVPLTPNTLYNVSFAATVKGAAVSQNWSFTTGAAN